MKTHNIHKQNIIYDIISTDSLLFELQGVGCDLFMMRRNKKLTKEQQKIYKKIIQTKTKKKIY